MRLYTASGDRGIRSRKFSEFMNCELEAPAALCYTSFGRPDTGTRFPERNKRMKTSFRKIFALFLAAVVLLGNTETAFAASGAELRLRNEAPAAESADSEQPQLDFSNPVTSGDWKYVLNEAEEAVVCGYLGTETEITIPSSLDGYTVTSVAGFNRSAENIQALERIVFPNTVKEIRDQAFFNLPNLSSVVLKEGLESIGESAFYDCYQLSSITLPSTLKTLGSQAFAYCNNKLKSISIPEGVSHLPDGLFYHCANLESVYLKSKYTTIGSDVFKFCSKLTRLDYPGTKEEWEALPNESELSYYTTVYYFCTVTFDYLGHGTAREPALVKRGKTFTKPSNPHVTGYTFSGWYTDAACENEYNFSTVVDDNFTLYAKWVPAPMEGTCGKDARWVLDETGTLTISGSGETSISYGTGSSVAPWNDSRELIRKVVIDKNITAIGEKMFQDCVNLETVEMPDGITSIGFTAFQNCSSLQDFTFPSKLEIIRNYAFSGCSSFKNLVLPDSLQEMGVYSFRGCSGLESVEIPDSLPKLGGGSFCDCPKLPRFTFPESVDIIEGSFFWGDTSLECVVIPASVTEIQRYAFKNCTALTDIYYGGTEEQWNAIPVGDDNEPLSSVTVHFFDPQHSHACAFETDKEATCTEDGRKTGICSICGRTVHETIPATGHSWNDGEVTTAPGCESTGVRTFTCSACGDHYTEQIPAMGHSWDDGAITKEASCTEKGVRTYTCTACQNTRTEDIPMLPHTEEADPAVPPTCTEPGLTEGSHCAVCGQVLTAQQTIPATGHSWDEGVVTKEPDCTEKGSKLYTCISCHSERTEEIPANGHSPVTDPAVPATCTEDGLTEGSHCEVCHTVLVPQETVPAAGHHYDNGLVTVPATCTENGVKTFTCTACGDSYTEVIPAAGHQPVKDPAVPATCTEDGLTEGSHCEVCRLVLTAQEVIPATGHSWDEGVITQPPTGTKPGVKTFTCTVCAATYTEEIPATGILANGTCGENLFWELSVEGVLTISGTGLMTDWTDYYGVAWNPYIDEIKSVIIEEGAESIGENSFTQAKNLMYVSLPDSLRIIGEDAFFACGALKSIELPDGLTTLSGSAFWFAGIESIRIPEGITKIDQFTFSDCKSLKNVVLPNTLTYIGFAAFRRTAIEEITLPSSLQGMNSAVFNGCPNLKELDIPYGIKVLNDGLVAECPALETVHIPETVTELSGMVFYQCTGLQRLDLPDSITKITSADCFAECGDRTFIHVTGNNDYIISYLEENEVPYIIDAPVSRIEMEESLLLIKGRTAKLDVHAFPEKSYEAGTLTLVSSDPDVCKVQSDGTVLAVSAGSCNIQASVESGTKAVTHVTVLEHDIEIEEVRITPESAVMEIGESLVLAAEILPANTTLDKTLSWSSSDPEIVSVDENGTVTALGKGSAVITAEAVNGVSGKCEIRVPIYAESITVSPSSVSVYTGKQYRLKASIYPEDANEGIGVSWISDSPEIAEVDENGIITGLREGEAVVSVVTDNGLYAECYVEVGPDTGFEYAYTYMQEDVRAIIDYLKSGKTIRHTQDQYVGYITYDEETGLLGLHLDNSSRGTEMSCHFDPIALRNIDQLHFTSTSGDDQTSTNFDTQTVTADTASNVKFTGKVMAWTSSTVSATVRIALLCWHAALIDTMSMGLGNMGFEGYDYVDKHPAPPVYDESDISILLGKQYRLKNALTEETPRTELTWTSDHPEIVSVDEAGIVSSHAVGKAVITAQAASGETAQHTVTVKPESGYPLSYEKMQENVRVLISYLEKGGKLDQATSDGSTHTLITYNAEKDVLTFTLIDIDQQFMLYFEFDPIALRNTTPMFFYDNTTQEIAYSAAFNTETVTYDSASELKIIGGLSSFTTAQLRSFARAALLGWTAALMDKTFWYLGDIGYEGFDCSSMSYIPAESLTLNMTETDLRIGKELTLEAAITPSTAFFKDLVWTSSNEQAATVDANGKVSGIAPGISYITVSSVYYPNLTARCKVTVKEPEPGPADPEVLEELIRRIVANNMVNSSGFYYIQYKDPSTNYTFTITWQNEVQRLLFHSSMGAYTFTFDYELATRSIHEEHGQFSYVRSSSPVIIVYAGAPIDMVSYTLGDQLKFILDESISYNYSDFLQYLQEFGKRASDTSMNGWNVLLRSKTGFDMTDIGFLNFYGGSAPGPQQEAEPNNSRADATWLTVGVPCEGEIGSYTKYKNDGVDEDFFRIDLEKGANYRLTFSPFMREFSSTTLLIKITDPGEKVKSITFTMENAGVDYYDFTASYTGTYYIRLHNYFDNTSRTEHYYSLVVDCTTILPEEIRLNKDSIAIAYGKTYQLKATVLPTDAQNKYVSWSSSDTSIATVSESGQVTAKGVGTAVITASTRNGKVTAKCHVRVLFTDVTNAKKWYYEPVYWAVDRHITTGAGKPALFLPDDDCKREQIVTFLWRMMGEPEPSEYIPFTDVSSKAYYYKAVSWAAEQGITIGLNDGTGRFGVGMACTRAMCVTFFYRCAGSPAVVHTEDDTFTDVKEGKYYYDPVTWAAQNGVTVGLNDGTGRFGVNVNCTRAMVVTFLSRYAKLIGKY